MNRHAAPIALALVLVTGCRVSPDGEQDTIDTALAERDTQTIELSSLPRPAPVITDTLVALDAGDSIRRDTTAPPVPREDELGALAATLTIPVAGVKAEELLDTFNEMRGTRRHDALDIPAPRGTPVLSATDGRVLRLFTSANGGLMIYAADASDRFILMYAHLDSYADGVSDAGPLRRGQVIGYVGTTGNAPPNLPHLHFAIARSTDVSRWWEGTPVDPLPLLVR
jgi:murein DD-endopeptidase MepM/ murein hydrolase activator NlpD